MPEKTSLRSLHAREGQLLVLPNVWDAGSARLVESLGAEAVVTTSSGVAWAIGYTDGNAAPIEKIAQVVANVMRAVRVPVSVDFEGGYSADPETVARNLEPLLDLGIAGINLEDGAGEPELLARKIEAIRRLPKARELFINARTDVFLRGLAPAETRVAETLSRGALYSRAGADGLFVPGLSDAGEIRAVTSGIGLPVNVMAVRALPARDALVKLGVRRLSAGGAIAQAAWKLVSDLSRDFLATGDSQPMLASALTYPELQALFARSVD